MKNYLFAGFLLSLFVTSANARSVGEPSIIWPNKDVKVCWQNEEPVPMDRIYNPGGVRYGLRTFSTLNNDLKSRVQNLITQEFTSDKTGIHFTGWEDCKVSTNYQAMILVGGGAVMRGQATIGRMREQPTYVPLHDHEIAYVYVNLNFSDVKLKASEDEAILDTFLHEFGHLAGLRHEHMREESLSDPNCPIPKKKTPLEPAFAQTAFFTTYDPMSIMNYCFVFYKQDTVGFKVSLPSDGMNPLYTDSTVMSSNVVGDQIEYIFRTGLSKKDVHGLKCLYKFNPREVSELCRPDYEP